ncbi:hypothetical protein BH683_021500 [Williamsia sp. 1138]|uniref:hypothetical protein n=1 Tax=Williamsia sp. 1138 TaxID=1903117 RepID=UPI000A112E9E|nr:hypothetical protein [Williamsia sp. 1138]OZG27011.1 hypothetical protein BH683_021500 [Williamsia sp. 1138]
MAAAEFPLFSSLHPVYRIIFRWALIAVLTLVAFWDSLASVLEESYSGSLIGYVLAIPWLALLAAQGVARRRSGELPIHDRQTDFIIGFMGLVLALLIKGVLVGRYADQYHLIRLDLLAMWLFVVSAAVVLFGLRPVSRFALVWLLLLTVFPLGFRIIVITLGGTRYAAAGVMVVLAAGATALAVGRTRRRGLIGAAGTVVVGMGILLVMYVTFPTAPVMAYTQIPPLLATALVAEAMYLYSRRGTAKTPMDRPINPLSAKTILLAVTMVTAFAVALSLISLPRSTAPPVLRDNALEFGSPLIAPAGWQTTDVTEYDFVKRFFGRTSNLIRQRLLAEEGNPAWDKLSRPRTVVVDSVTTLRPVAFSVYPDNVIYNMTATRSSNGREIDLGNDVVGEIFTVVDDTLLVTWTKLTWTWRNRSAAQRVTLLTVDNHDADAPFPKPEDALVDNLNTLFTVLIRGNSVVDNNNPNFKDAGMLTVLGRELVAAQLEPARQAS